MVSAMNFHRISAASLTFFLFVVCIPCGCDEFLMGYLTGSRRVPQDIDYQRPGLMISGAISLAVQEINSHYPLYGNHTLGFIVAETYGKELKSIRQTAELTYVHNVSAYIGPQETCAVEARMAASFNLPMVSYVSKFQTINTSHCLIARPKYSSLFNKEE